MEQPVIRVLDLPALGDLLAEHAVFVAQSVADGRDRERRHRIDEAGGQPAEPAVAQPRVGLLFGQVMPVPVLVRGEVVADILLDLEVVDRVGQRPADEELHRQVVNLLGVLLVVGAVGQQPSLREQIAERPGQGLEPLARAGLVLGHDVVEDQAPVVTLVVGDAERTALVLVERIQSLLHSG